MDLLPFVRNYAVQSYASAEKGLLEAYEAEIKHWYIDLSLDANRLEQWSDERIKNLLIWIDHYSVSPIIHGNYKLPLAFDVDAIRIVAVENIKREIDFCARLNAPLIVHAGVIVEPRLVLKTKETALKLFVSSLEDLLPYAREKNVQIYLENLSNYKDRTPFHYIFTSPEEVEYVLNKMPDVKLLFDCGHANINNNAISFFEKFYRSIEGLSLSNNNGFSDQHLGLKRGTLDYNQLVLKIIELNWSGMVAFETRGMSIDSSINDLKEIYSSLVGETAV